MLYIYHFSIAFAFVYISRFFQQRLSSLFALRHVPGPKPSSWVWGEEKVLYYNTPGALYLDWHRTYGNVVKFTGAFGVGESCSNLMPRSLLSLFISISSFLSRIHTQYRLFWERAHTSFPSQKACVPGFACCSERVFSGWKVIIQCRS
jgi:hypothetical protein